MRLPPGWKKVSDKPPERIDPRSRAVVKKWTIYGDPFGRTVSVWQSKERHEIGIKAPNNWYVQASFTWAGGRKLPANTRASEITKARAEEIAFKIMEDTPRFAT